MSNNDYLWDRSGDPDPEIQKLENLLTPLSYRPGRPFRKRRYYWPVAAGIAATVLVAVGALWFATRPRGPSWQVVAILGSPKQEKMSKGTTVETDSASKVRLELSSFGHVEMEPNTRLKLLETKHDEQRMDLAHGKIHAVIWAPPHQFYVNTPSAVTVDLGCSYTLEVDKNGDGTVRVDFGWVAFEDRGKESLIPAHAICVTRRGKGPGIPYYEDAPTTIRTAVDRFDMSADISTVPTILSDARQKDAVTVWHLLRRVPVQDRGVVYDRLAQLVHVPQNVTREQALAGDPQATDALWNALGLGDIQWWRQWKR